AVQELVRRGQVPVAAVSVLYSKSGEEQLRLARAIAGGSVKLSELAAGGGSPEVIQTEISQRLADAALAPEDSARAGSRGGAWGRPDAAPAARRRRSGSAREAGPVARTYDRATAGRGLGYAGERRRARPRTRGAAPRTARAGRSRGGRWPMAAGGGSRAR